MLVQSPWSGAWYGEPTKAQWRRIHLDKDETWKRDGFDPAWFTEPVIKGHCPQCGAPIYMPRIWEKSNPPPPASYTCECRLTNSHKSVAKSKEDTAPSPKLSRSAHIAKVQAEEDPAYTGDYYMSDRRDPYHHIAFCCNTTLDDDHPTKAAILAGHLSLRDAEDLKANFSPEGGILYGTIDGWINERKRVLEEETP